MKKLIVPSLALALVGLLAVAFAAESAGRTLKRGALVHMVAFKFKPEATQDQIKNVEDAFGALKKKIPQIVSFEWGTNVSPEKLDKGFTHGFILTFKDDKDRDLYLKHPDHQAFAQLVGPVLGDVFVVDFWAKE
jgi:hypothetical protein